MAFPPAHLLPRSQAGDGAFAQGAACRLLVKDENLVSWVDAPHEAFQPAQVQTLWGAGPRAVVSHPAGRGRGGVVGGGPGAPGFSGLGNGRDVPFPEVSGGEGQFHRVADAEEPGVLHVAQAGTLGWVEKERNRKRAERGT